MAQKRTPSETLMAALEEFGKDEPSECLLIFTTQAGDICNMSSTNTLSIKLGMLKTVEVFIVEDIRNMKSEDVQ